MANEMLKFRKGTFAQINAAAKVPGTIYIAKDEKAMYVDIDTTENGRIRIGDFIRVETVAGIVPPYSESALYYVEADNALLKYMGAEKGWKQVNGTDDLSAEITGVKDRVSALESTVGSATSGLVKDVATLKTTVGNADAGLVKDVATNAADIVELKKAVGMGEGEAEGVGAVVAGLVTDLDALETEVHGTDGNGGMKATLAQHTSKIGALEEASALHAEKTYVDSTFAKAADVYAKSEVYTKTEADKKISDAVAAEAEIARAAEQANASAAAGALSKANQAYELADGKIDLAGVEALGYAKATQVESDIAAAKKAVADDVAATYATKTALAEVDGKVSKNTSDIGTINETLKTVVTQEELAGKGYATTAQVATAKQEAISAAATSAAELYATKTELNTTNQNVSAAQSKANDAYALAETKTTAAAVKDQIEAYGYATTGQVATAKQEAIDAAKTAGDKAYAEKAIEQTVASHTSSLATLNGAATVSGSVAEAKKAADDAQAAINEWKTAHAGDYTNTQIDAAVADAKKAGTDAAATANANTQSISSLGSRVKAIEDDYLVEQDLVDAKAELEGKIEDEINAANAMTFKNGVASQTALDAILEVRKGDTYVVTTQFGVYYPGDFLIASGDENEEGLIENVTWTHVKTGYDASLDQRITGADNKIKLSTGTGAPGTEVAFAATGSASVAVADGTVTIGMVWEDF